MRALTPVLGRAWDTRAWRPEAARLLWSHLGHRPRNRKAGSRLQARDVFIYRGDPASVAGDLLAMVLRHHLSTALLWAAVTRRNGSRADQRYRIHCPGASSVLGVRYDRHSDRLACPAMFPQEVASGAIR